MYYVACAVYICYTVLNINCVILRCLYVYSFVVVLKIKVFSFIPLFFLHSTSTYIFC